MQDFTAHRVFAFFDFALPFEDLPECCFADLALEPESPGPRAMDARCSRAPPVVGWLPDRLKAAATTRYRDESVLEETRIAVGNDFYPPIQRLLSGELTDRCRTFRLTQRARDLLNDGSLYHRDVLADQRFGHELVLVLSSAADKRIRASTCREVPASLLAESDPKAMQRVVVPVQIHDVLVYHFATGRAVCQVSLEARRLDGFPLSSVLLSELLQHCGRFSNLAWKETPPSITKPSPDSLTQLVEIDGFTMGALAARLVCGRRATMPTKFRTYTHIYAQIDPDGPETNAEQLRALGRVFARRYTADYDLSDQATGFQTVSDFDNVQHVSAREGAATIVDPRTGGRTIPFLEGFLADGLENRYLPISVLNFHHLAQGLELSARSVLGTQDPGVDHDDPDAVIHAWTDLQRQLAILNARFRFRQVSQISMHNAFNRALRDSFDLDGLEAELASDLNQMSARVQAEAALQSTRQREEFRRGYRWVTAFVTSAVTGVFVLELASIVHAFNQGGFDAFEIVAGVGALVLAALAFWWVRLKTDRDPE